MGSGQGGIAGGLIVAGSVLFCRDVQFFSEEMAIINSSDICVCLRKCVVIT